MDRSHRRSKIVLGVVCDQLSASQPIALSTSYCILIDIITGYGVTRDQATANWFKLRCVIFLRDRESHQTAAHARRTARTAGSGGEPCAVDSTLDT